MRNEKGFQKIVYAGDHDGDIFVAIAHSKTNYRVHAVKGDNTRNIGIRCQTRARKFAQGLREQMSSVKERFNK